MAAEKAPASSSKTDTLVKVVLVFFISLLSFSVGTFVGKQVSDSDHRRLALEGEYKTDRSVASTNEGESADKISDKEVETLTEEFVAKEKPTTEGAEGKEGEVKGEGKAEGKDEVAAKEPTKEPAKEFAKTEAKVEAAEEKPDASGYKTFKREGKTAESKTETKTVESKEAKAEKPEATKAPIMAVAEKVASGEAPTDGKVAEERKPASVLPSMAKAAVGKFTVQVGAYTSESEAKNRAAELKGKGWTAFYTSASVSGKTWYRVSVGLFKDMNSAKEFRTQFMKEAGTKSAMVQKIVE